MAMRAMRPHRKVRPLPPSRPDDHAAEPFLPNRPVWGKRVYAICFDLDIEILKRNYHNESRNNSYADIGRILARHGFNRQQGSVYFGDDPVDPVKCVLAIQDVSKECPWFKRAVTDVRMLRIEENNDLMPAVGEPDLGLAPSPERQPIMVSQILES